MNIIKKLVYIFALVCLSSCLFPISKGDVDLSREIRSFEAYGQKWKYYSEIIRRDYYTLDSDLFRYVKFEKYLEAEDGTKISIPDAIYIKQRSNKFKHFVIETRPLNEIEVFSHDQKIFLKLYGIEQSKLTDCFGYYEYDEYLKQPDTKPAYWGEYNTEDQHFYLTHFLPLPGTIFKEMGGYRAYPMHIQEIINRHSLPLICEKNVNMEEVARQKEDVWNVEEFKKKLPFANNEIN